MNFDTFKNSYQKIPVQEYLPYSRLEAPILTVKVITYNHAPYIKACLDSILRQETNFDFNILIGEDNSSDSTRTICEEYAKKYPNKIRLILHERANNIFVNGKPTGVFNSVYCNFLIDSKYVAFCEGDDYWEDKTALQQQIDFLEGNSDYSMCFYDATLIDSKGRMLRPSILQEKEKHELDRNLKNIFSNYTIPNLTKVYRNNLISIFEKGLEKIVFGDNVQFGKLLQHGKARYLPTIQPAKYRKHEGGVCSQVPILKKTQTYIEAIKHLETIYTPSVKEEIYYGLAFQYSQLFFYNLWLNAQFKINHLKQCRNYCHLSNTAFIPLIWNSLKLIVSQKIARTTGKEKTINWKLSNQPS